MAKRKSRAGHCESCGARVPNLCAVSYVMQLCQADARGLMIGTKGLRIVVEDLPPEAREPDADGVDDALARAALNARTKAGDALGSLERSGSPATPPEGASS